MKIPEFHSSLAPFLRGIVELRQSLGYRDKCRASISFAVGRQLELRCVGGMLALVRTWRLASAAVSPGRSV